MTLQSSGAISINNINTELGSASGTPRSLGDTSSRNLAGVPSGAISLSNFYGKSNELVLDFGTNAMTDVNLRAYADFWGYTNHAKVICKFAGNIDASATSVPAIEVGSWPAGTAVHVIIYGSGQVRGRGGIGGNGSPNVRVAGSPGGAGGPAIKATYTVPGGCTIEIQGSGSIRPGGGGGGGGGGYYNHSNENGGSIAGQNGGNGYSVGIAATLGGNATAGANGGNGGAQGTAGTAGATKTTIGAAKATAGGSGGAGGAAMVNSAYATKVGWSTGVNYWGALS